MRIEDLTTHARQGNAHAARLLVRHYARRIDEAAHYARHGSPEMRQVWVQLARNWLDFMRETGRSCCETVREIRRDSAALVAEIGG